MTEDDLKHFDTRRLRAILAGDADELSLLLHERLVYTHSNGEVDTKQTFLRRVQQGKIIYHTITVESFRVETLNDAFLQWAYFCSQVTVEGRQIEVASQFMSVTVRTSIGLQLLSYQATPLAAGCHYQLTQPWFRG